MNLKINKQYDCQEVYDQLVWQIKSIREIAKLMCLIFDKANYKDIYDVEEGKFSSETVYVTKDLLNTINKEMTIIKLQQ